TPHYYTREKTVMIKRPDVSPATKTPRLAVYYSNDEGRRWHKAGYFGMDANFFAFVAPEEGTYRIRFVGPGFAPTRLCDSIPPHRVYHVDATPPSAIVQVNPVKPTYQVGDTVTLSWNVTDPNLDPKGTVTIYEVTHPAKVKISGDYPLNGSVGVVVPPSAADGGVRFGVEATDKAGNIGRGFSFLLQTVAAASQPEAPAAVVKPEATPVVRPDPTPVVRPDPAPAVKAQAQPTPPVAPAPAPTPAAAPRTPSNTDRVPIVPSPNMPLTLPAPPTTKPAGSALDPVDQAVEPSYRPKLYPATPGK
ncbi:MAG: hypothetical protein PHU85_20635, partial [Phycisphaerae bacterium]|nr:hypothetical protein [Phycisphaerae bacterium]